MALNNNVRPVIDSLSPGGADASTDDRRLEQVIDDNIFTTVHMGHESAFEFSDGEVHAKDVYNPTADSSHDGQAREYEIIEMEVYLSDSGSESNYVKAIVIGDGHQIPPNTGTRYVRQADDESGTLEDNENDPDILTIDIDNDLMEYRPNTDEITRIFTGVVSNASRRKDNSFEFMAFWPGYNTLQDGRIEITRPRVSGLRRGPTEELRDALASPSKASHFASKIGEKVTEGFKFPYEVNLLEEGVEIGETVAGRDKMMNLSTEDIMSEDSNGALTRITESTNSVWDIDRYGTFAIGPPIPDGDTPNAVKSHKLRYLTEVDAGRQGPMWRSVKVVGDGVVSQDGYESKSMVNENPVVLKGNVVDSDGDDLAEPVFVYRNMEINTTEEARDVLNKLVDNLKEQLASGEVTVVGHPELWPGHAIELPDTKDQPFANEKFTIRKVIHRLNNQDGFVTTVKVGGQTNATQSFFTGDVEPQKEYGTGPLPVQPGQGNVI